jgi:UDPglucose 6-dehydrogenase
MDVRSAELTKYAANAMLATRISFMNEMALLAEKLGADIEQVRRGIGSDARIGSQFLYPGCGYGGSCFPKDVKALVAARPDVGEPLHVLQAVERPTSGRSTCWWTRVVNRFGADLAACGSRSGGWRSSPRHRRRARGPEPGGGARTRRARGAHRGARSRGDGPGARGPRRAARPGVRRPRRWRRWKARTPWSSSPSGRCTAAPDFTRMASVLRQPVVIDGRNLYEPAMMRECGLEYHPLGRPAVAGAPAPLALAA